MRPETIKKVVILFSCLVSLISASIALFSGGDIFYVIVFRLCAVFFICAVTTWTALTVISSTVVDAASKHIDMLRDEFTKEDEERLANELAQVVANDIAKGQNLDLTSPDDNIDLLDLETPTIESENSEFEPFKPRRIESDIAN